VKGTVEIAGRRIGAGEPPYLVAELSANHLGSLDRALAIVDAAARAGADAVKLQTYRPDTITIDHTGPGFVLEGGPWAGRRLFDLYREAHTPWEWHEALFARGRACGVAVFSSPFDSTAVELLEKLGAPAYKIASFEIVDLPLIERCAATGKPLVISTGMAARAEIEEAVSTAERAGAGGIVLLHCVSGYPTPAEEANLRTIPDMARRFGIPIGLSDHTLGTAVAVASVAVDAAMIEKHITLSRKDGGADSGFSLEPEEFAAMASACRTAYAALGEVDYALADSEAANARLRRSLYVVADVAAGETLTDRNVRSIRPGYGLAPKHYRTVIGRRATRALARGTPLAWTDFE
jgi:N-acetylneuraminate synthase